jgi:O-antigen ligase
MCLFHNSNQNPDTFPVCYDGSDVSNQELRWNLASIGLVIVGFLGAIYAFLRLGAFLAGGLFLLVAVAGVFSLLQMQKAYSVALLIVGILAFVFAILGYLNRGLVTLTILYILLAIVGIVRGGQAYRATE